MPISPANRNRSRTLLSRLGLALLCLGVVTCGGDGGGGPTGTGAINISPNTIAFTTAPGGALDAKTVGITPATVDLTGLTATSAYTGTPPSPWLEAALGSTNASLASPAILTLQVTNSSLPAGTYQATVTVESPTAANAPKVNVTLTIEAAAALAISTQPSATAASGEALAEAPVVQLQTANGEAVGQAGIEVSVVLEGGGSLAGPATSTTDAQGVATFDGLSVTALIGERTLLFTAPGLTEVRSNPIAITVGAAARIAASSVTPLLVDAGIPINDPPAAQVTDIAGNPVEGVSVTFAVKQGGGVIDPTTAVTTGADGLATSNSWTIGAIAGPNAVTATADGLEGSPVEFATTGTNDGVVPGPVDGAKSTVAAAPNSFQAGSAGTTITVTARDAANNPIGGATVTLASSGTGNAFGSTSLTTGTSGSTLGKATTTYTSTKAEAKSITAQITAGTDVVSPAAAAVTVTAGAPSGATSTVTASAPNPGLANSSLVTITVKDANNNPVSGRTVSLSVGVATGAVFLGPGSTTNSSGVTTASLSSTTGGTYQVQATIAGGPTITQTASVTFLLSFASDIQTEIFAKPFDLGGGNITGACTGCHLPDGGGEEPDLRFVSITGAHDAGFVVVPGDANNSLLIQALEHSPSIPDPATEWMPSFTQQLPVDVIAKIRLWINQNGPMQQLTP